MRKLTRERNRNKEKLNKGSALNTEGRRQEDNRIYKTCLEEDSERWHTQF